MSTATALIDNKETLECLSGVNYTAEIFVCLQKMQIFYIFGIFHKSWYNPNPYSAATPGNPRKADVNTVAALMPTPNLIPA